MGILGLKPGGVSDVRKAVAKRGKAAAENLRAKNKGYSDEARSAYPGLTAQPSEEPGASNFARSVLQRGEAAAQGQGQPPPGVSMGAAGMGEPPPPDPFMDTATGGMGYGGAMRIGEQLNERVSWRQDNTPMHDATRQLNDEQRALGMERIDNTEDAYTTQAAMARDRSVLANEAHEAQAQMAAREQFMASQQARKRQEIEDNVAKYTTVADEAAAEFAKAEEFDPGSAWANKSVGRKIRIMLAGLGRGLTGGNPADVLKESLQLELAAHKQARSDAGDKLTAARGQMSSAQQTMQTFLAMTGDERVADALVERKTLAGIQAKMRAMEAEYGPAVINDKWREVENMMAQEMAALDYKIVEREQAAPKYFQRSAYKIRGPQRKLMMEQAGQMIDSAGEAVKQGGAAQAAQSKAQAMDEHGLTDRDWQQIEAHGKDTEVGMMEGLKRQLKELVAPVDIEGVKAMGVDWIGDEPARFKRKVKLATESLGRLQSKGVINDQELVTFTEMLTGGVDTAWMHGTSGEAHFRENVDSVLGMIEPRLETKYRSMTPAAREYIARQKNSDFAGESHSTGRGRKRVQAADGSITTNASEFE